jgi:hypothetical protein
MDLPPPPPDARIRALGQAWHALRWTAFLMLMLSGSMQRAWASEEAEYRIKAAFLCKFGNYVDWPEVAPALADPTFVIGVMGGAVAAQAVAAAANGQAVNGRPIVVRHLERSDSMQGLNILFVARSHATRLPEALAALKDQPVLVVTEQDSAPAGSMVNFVVVEDKVKFDVAPVVAERRGLRISARLLGVARNLIARAP